MTDEPVYYHPPPEHQHHFRSMVRFLLVFFSVLIVAVVAIVLNAQWLATKLPFEAEKRFVGPVERLAGYFGGTAPRSENALVVENYLQSLVDDMARQMGVPENFEISVHYLQSQEANAFATLGGHLFVLSGLLDALPDENSLAMVLGHEVAHIKHRDPVAALGRGVAIQIIYSFLTGSGSGQDIATYGSNIGLTFFSREQEQAADLAAMAGLQARYGHVAGSETLFRVLSESEDGGDASGPSWMSTHPQLKARIETLEAYAEAQGWVEGSPRALPVRVNAALLNGQTGLKSP